MQSEHLQGIPTTISRARMFDALVALGFERQALNKIKSVELGATKVWVTMFWTDDNGRKIHVQHGDKLNMPEVSIELELTGSMLSEPKHKLDDELSEQGAPRLQPDALCRDVDLGHPECTKPARHTTPHVWRPDDQLA